MLFSVFLSSSAVMWPATVTRPALAECLYCRWPLLALILYQPSASMSLMISRTFILPSFLPPSRTLWPWGRHLACRGFRPVAGGRSVWACCLPGGEEPGQALHVPRVHPVDHE